VVFFPTWRPGLTRDEARCGDTPEPPRCSSVQQYLHEGPTAVIHFTCAVVFILCLAVIAGLFARENRKLAKNDRRLARDATVQQTCMILILAAVGWVALGQWVDLTIWKITPLYAGEVLAVWAFGVSWLLASRSHADGSSRR
jgi:anaerobic C4-dicarboxylate transporter